jgi:dihydroorotate dehydrogenase
LLFALDPERAHRLTIDALKLAARAPRRHLSGSPAVIMGLRFPNRLGVAAGFDKNAEAVDGLGNLGFGFIEVGTVTLRPQPGQPRPRLFRLPQANALINRMGFPNDGAAAIARRLAHTRYRGIIGINIGKNAQTPLERAVDDYVGCLRLLHAAADYIAINISSPNTTALRELHAPERLEPLLTALLQERARLAAGSGHRGPPLVLKVSPDLDGAALQQLAGVITGIGLDGVIATNTTTRRDTTEETPDASGLDDGRPAGMSHATVKAAQSSAAQSGGLSGAPVHQAAMQTVAALRRLLGPAFAIIGAGGIDSARKALALRAAGADLVQLYTGLVFRGPALVAECLRAL